MTISGIPNAVAAVVIATAPVATAVAAPPTVAPAAATAEHVQLSGTPSGTVPVHMATAKGKQILVDGQPFKFQGINVYDLADVAANNPEDLRKTLKTIAWSGATVVRFWAFAYLKPEVFARILDESKALGLNLKFIPVLGNQWQHSRPELKVKDAAWYQQGYKDQYRPHVEQTVAALKDRPEILMWELMNEPQCTDQDALYNFAADVSGLVHANAAQLISLGTLSEQQAGLGDGGFKRMHTLPNINVVSFHDYPEYGDTPEARAKQAVAVDKAMDTALTVGRELQKPVMIGETGSKVTAGYHGETIRTPGAAMDNVANRVKRAMTGGAVGTLSWGPEPEGHGVDGDGYGFVFTPDTPAGDAVKGRMLHPYPDPLGTSGS